MKYEYIGGPLDGIETLIKEEVEDLVEIPCISAGFNGQQVVVHTYKNEGDGRLVFVKSEVDNDGAASSQEKDSGGKEPPEKA